jgi:fermentation-respiration switch protein FrsA (DUF1100 family)
MNKRKIALIAAVAVILLMVVEYLGAGVFIYNTLTHTEPKCDGNPQENQNSPAAFTVSETDTTPYLMPDFQTVSFPSRDSTPLTIAGWYVPATAADDPNTPTVILVHGLNSCRHSTGILLPAGMLHKNGFNVLMIDLRNHGDSQIKDGRYAGGTEEYKDVLGAWDWLTTQKNIPPERIGLIGESLGAATAMIAMGEEPRITATWEDSSFADIGVAIQAELTRNKIPTFFAPAGPLMARLIGGVDLTSLSPLSAIAKLNGRPVFVTHGTAGYPPERAVCLRPHQRDSGQRRTCGFLDCGRCRACPGSFHPQRRVRAANDCVFRSKFTG